MFLQKKIHKNSEKVNKILQNSIETIVEKIVSKSQLEQKVITNSSKNGVVFQKQKKQKTISQTSIFEGRLGPSKIEKLYLLIKVYQTVGTSFSNKKISKQCLR